jgi:cytochrome c oxidase subunit 2
MMGAVQSVLDPAGPQARTIAEVTWWFFGLLTVVYVLVIGALLWAVLRRRRDSDDAPETSRRLTTVVASAVGVTIATLVVLSVVSVVAGRGLTSPSGPGAITIDVIGHQWWWEFQYHDVSANERVNSPNELHIPVGVPVALKAMSRDVIHSFWVPNLHGKKDMIPGHPTGTFLRADRAGTFWGQCAEFCGHQHAKMAFLVVAEPSRQFTAWLETQRDTAHTPAGSLARRGQEVFLASSCVLCHAVGGTPAGSRAGPDLTHLASRRTIAAGTLPNTRGHLAGWVVDPQQIKPGVRMPPNAIEPHDLQALLAYLESLR